MKKAISYIRFSSKAQATGDSFKRQNKLVEQWLKSNPEYELDQNMQFADLGISGYSGANAETGAFGDFLAAVKEGHIAKGSVLLVESLDRISRQNIRLATRRLTEVLESGVDVVTLSDGKHYTEKSLEDSLAVISMVLLMQRSNEESETKSKRVRSGWERIRKEAAETGKVMTSRTVAWVKVNAAGDAFELVPEHVKAVKRVFELRLQGLSHIKIAKAMNEEGFRTLNQYNPVVGGWSQATITDLLSNKSIIGYKVPSKSIRVAGVKDIPNYYPAVVSEAEFFAVQQLKTRSGRRPSSDNPLLTNIFKGVMRCANCGHGMLISGVTAKRNGNYRCRVRYEGRCNAKGISRLQVDKALISGLLYNVHRLNLTGSNEKEIGRLQVEKETLQKQRERLVRLAMAIDDQTVVADELKAVVEKVKDIEKAITECQQRERSSHSETIEHLDLNTKPGRVEAQIIVKRMVKEIVVDTDKKVCKVVFYSGLMLNNFPLDRVIDGAYWLEILPIIGDKEFDFTGISRKPRKQMIEDMPDWVKESIDNEIQ